MSAAAKAALTAMLSSLRGTERSFVMHPEEIEVDLMTPGGSMNGAGLLDSVNHHDTMMFRSILAHFITTANQPNGNYGSTSSFIDMFMYAEQAVALFIEDMFSFQVIRPFCDLNFDMAGRPYPRLKFANIEYIDMQAVTEAMARLAGAKIIEPDNELEEDVRKLFGWPKKGEPRVPAPSSDDPEDSTGEPKNQPGRPTKSNAGKDAKVNQGDRQSLTREDLEAVIALSMTNRQPEQQTFSFPVSITMPSGEQRKTTVTKVIHRDEHNRITKVTEETDGGI